MKVRRDSKSKLTRPTRLPIDVNCGTVFAGALPVERGQCDLYAITVLGGVLLWIFG
jgi:hypothetical protein